jgi:hypothetical protein
MIPSALSQAKSDPRLRGAALAVYVWALEHLDTMEERPVKILPLALDLHMKPHSAIFSLRRLVAIGYLARGARPKGQPRRYRLLPAPRIETQRRAA